MLGFLPDCVRLLAWTGVALGWEADGLTMTHHARWQSPSHDSSRASNLYEFNVYAFAGTDAGLACCYAGRTGFSSHNGLQS